MKPFTPAKFSVGNLVENIGNVAYIEAGEERHRVFTSHFSGGFILDITTVTWQEEGSSKPTTSWFYRILNLEHAILWIEERYIKYIPANPRFKVGDLIKTLKMWNIPTINCGIVIETNSENYLYYTILSESLEVWRFALHGEKYLEIV